MRLWPDEREELKQAVITGIVTALEFVGMWAILMVPVAIVIGG